MRLGKSLVGSDAGESTEGAVGEQNGGDAVVQLCSESDVEAEGSNGVEEDCAADGSTLDTVSQDDNGVTRDDDDVNRDDHVEVNKNDDGVGQENDAPSREDDDATRNDDDVGH